MKRRNKKFRKTSLRGMSDSSNNKENTFKEVFFSNFRIITREPSTHSCELNNRTRKNKRKPKDMEESADKQIQRYQKKYNKSPSGDWYENNRNLTFPTVKVSSISFFIPLNTCVEYDSFSCINFSNSFLFYKSNNCTVISRYQSERKYYNFKENRIPFLQIKQRSSSESSGNSEDSVVCFETDNELSEDSYICNSMESTSHDVDEKLLETTPDFSDFSCSKDKASVQKRKKVQFVDNTKLATVHLIVAWSYAYKAARISPWEIIARDSNRFKIKIHSLEPILNPILSPEHRTRVWKTRICVFNDENHSNP